MQGWRWPPIPKYSAVSGGGVAGGGVACGGDACGGGGVAGGGVACGGDACGGSSVSIVGVACDGDACGGGSCDDAPVVLECQSIPGDGGATRDNGCSRNAQPSSVGAMECDTDAADIDPAEPMSPAEIPTQSSDMVVDVPITQLEEMLELVFIW